MTLLAGLILFSVLGAWLSARQRAAGAALAFGVIGTVLFCGTPLGAALPQLINGFVQGSAQVGAQLVDGQPSERGSKDPGPKRPRPKDQEPKGGDAR